MHSAKHGSTLFTARQCINCDKVNRFEGFSQGVLLNRVERVEDENSSTFVTKIRSLRYSESGGENCGDEKQADFLSLLIEASAVLVVKA